MAQETAGKAEAVGPTRAELQARIEEANWWSENLEGHQFSCACLLCQRLPVLRAKLATPDETSNDREPTRALEEPFRSAEWFRGFEAAHELMECGHSRGDLRDPNYVLGAGGITNCHCVGCASAADWGRSLVSLREGLLALATKWIDRPANREVEIEWECEGERRKCAFELQALVAEKLGDRALPAESEK
jgi:hypothetical protein